MTTSEIPSHNHGSVNISGNFNSVLGQKNSSSSGALSWSSYSSYGEMNTASSSDKYAKTPGDLTLNNTHTHSSVGGDSAHNNIPPYLSVNIWKRTK